MLFFIGVSDMIAIRIIRIVSSQGIKQKVGLSTIIGSKVRHIVIYRKQNNFIYFLIIYF